MRTTINDKALRKGLRELQGWVVQRQPDARFGQPHYLEEEEAWVVETYLPDDEDEEFLNLLADKETDILLGQGVCICTVTLPRSRYPGRNLVARQEVRNSAPALPEEAAASMPDLRVKRLRPGARLPQHATPSAAGLDLFACLEEPAYLVIGQDPVLVPTGIALELPPGYEAQVRPRSGLAARGVSVVFGTIDSDYRGEILVTMYLLAPIGSHTVRHGDRIAQLVVARLADLPLVEADELSPTERGAAGHGSTGA